MLDSISRGSGFEPNLRPCARHFIVCLVLAEPKENYPDINEKSADCNVHDPWCTQINQCPVPEEMCGKQIGRTDGRTHIVIKVYTSGSCKRTCKRTYNGFVQ